MLEGRDTRSRRSAAALAILAVTTLGAAVGVVAVHSGPSDRQVRTTGLAATGDGPAAPLIAITTTTTMTPHARGPGDPVDHRGTHHAAADPSAAVGDHSDIDHPTGGHPDDDAHLHLPLTYPAAPMAMRKSAAIRLTGVER